MPRNIKESACSCIMSTLAVSGRRVSLTYALYIEGFGHYVMGAAAGPSWRHSIQDMPSALLSPRVRTSQWRAGCRLCGISPSVATCNCFIIGTCGFKGFACVPATPA